MVTFDMDDTTSMWRVLETRDTCDVTLWRNPHKKCFNSAAWQGAAVTRLCHESVTQAWHLWSGWLVWARCNRYSCSSPALPRPGRWLNQGRQCPLEFSNFDTDIHNIMRGHERTSILLKAFTHKNQLRQFYIRTFEHSLTLIYKRFTDRVFC